MVVGKVLELIMKDGPGCGLHLNVDKTKVFLPKEYPRSRLAELVMKRVTKTIGLMDVIAKVNDPQCEVASDDLCNTLSVYYLTSTRLSLKEEWKFRSRKHCSRSLN
nr:hypothetical protein [Tanacetum cinerariifolium]